MTSKDDEAPSGAAPGAQSVLSFLTPDQVQAMGGLPPEGVVGLLGGGGALDEPSFQPNRLFIDFLHEVIGTHGPRDPDLRAAAAAQGDEWVYVIDQRTPEGAQGHVPPEDIVGAFEVRAGQVVEGSYRANERHRVFTRDGMFRLGPFLQASLVQELMRRARGRPRL